MRNHLVIPDGHARPGISNARFLWAGKLAAERQPDVIVCLGDLFDMPSLSSYDKGKRSFHGRSYQDDIAAGVEALKWFNMPINELNRHKRYHNKKQYLPRKVFIKGNHEDRVTRVLDLNEELDGAVSHDHFKLKEYGWEVVEYRDYVEIDGIYYSHFFPSGIKGEPISGLNIGASLVAKKGVSCTVGHAHLYDLSVRAKPDGRKIIGLCAGWYGDSIEEYARHTQHMWVSQLCYKHNVKDGEYDLETISLARMREIYA